MPCVLMRKPLDSERFGSDAADRESTGLESTGPESANPETFVIAECS